MDSAGGMCASARLGIRLRVRSTAVMLYRTRLRASGNPPAMPFPTEGIYARMRYPLYAGNFLIWFGIVLYTGTDWFVIGATALMPLAT